MKKTINCKILIVFSILLFSCFWLNEKAKALDNHTIPVYSNIYNASSVIDVEFRYEVVADGANPVGATGEPTGLLIRFDNVMPVGNLTTVMKELDFSGTNYVNTGIYKYKIKEVASSNSEYAVSGEEYEIYVVVSGAEKNVYHLAKNLADDTKGKINFNHSPEYTYVKISAATMGDVVDKNEYFRYKIEVDSLCPGCRYDVLGQDEYVRYGNRVIRTSNVYVADGQNYMYVYLKHGQVVTVGLSSGGAQQIPVGTKFKISIDENLNERKWKILIDGKEVDVAGFLLDGRGLVVELLAERNLLNPNTGLFGELGPFMFLVLLGFSGVMIFVFVRRQDEEYQYGE